jgi:PEP-CTERM motif
VLTGNFNVYGDFVPLAGRANSYLALATSGAWSGDVARVRTLIDPTGASQNQVYLTAATLGGVPEPTTWAMLIVGFGIIGAAMRRRGRRASAGAARVILIGLRGMTHPA